MLDAKEYTSASSSSLHFGCMIDDPPPKPVERPVAQKRKASVDEEEKIELPDDEDVFRLLDEIDTDKLPPSVPGSPPKAFNVGNH